MCHDRYFLDRVVDKLFVFSGDGQIEIVHGSYSDYKDSLDEVVVESAHSTWLILIHLLLLKLIKLTNLKLVLDLMIHH